jgi:acylphosphatase
MATGEAVETAVRVRIEGRVQGVGFRYWTADTANALGLRGWVRNRRDGSVEAVFAGRAALVAEMIRHCRDGPVLAMVTSVEASPESETVAPGFHLAPTG